MQWIDFRVFMHVGLQDATVGGDMLHANRATLWRTNY